LEECQGDQGVLRKAETWPKADGVYPMYLKHSTPLRLPDEQMVERDATVLHERVANRKKMDAKWQRLLDMKDAQIQFIKEERDRSVGVDKDLHESSFAATKGYQGRDRRWHAWIEDRMDALGKFEVYAEQQVSELDDARSKFAVEAASNEVVRDAMAFLKKKRKRKSKWGGDRNSQQMIVRVQRRSRTEG
jgi:hypothetical protein